MSSSELLALLDELPETSKFKEASQRTFRLVEYTGDGEHNGKLFRAPVAEILPRDVEVIAEYVDWTYDRKLLARNTRELASLRADGHDYQPDFTGLLEPLEAILIDRRRKAAEELRARAQNHIHAGLYAYERR